MQYHRVVRNRRGPTYASDIAETLTPRHGPSPSLILCDIDSAPPDMASSTANAPDDFVQVVDDVIDISLIDNAVQSLGLESAPEVTYTELKWTAACEALRRAYVDYVHPSVIDRPQIAIFVKPYTETQRTFRTVAHINSTARKTAEFAIGLKTDYHVIIPLVPQGLPTWAESSSTKMRQKVPWKKGSVVYIKGGTNLICTKDGEGIYVWMGGEKKT